MQTPRPVECSRYLVVGLVEALMPPLEETKFSQSNIDIVSHCVIVLLVRISQLLLMEIGVSLGNGVCAVRSVTVANK